MVDGGEPLRRLVAVVTSVALVGVFLFGLGVAYTLGFGYDSHAYWVAARDLDHLYERPPLAQDAYLYSPAFIQILWPIAQLPWPVFAVIWAAASAAAFFWLLRRLQPLWFVLGMLACVPEVLTGNVYGPMAVALVLGVRRSWPWVLPLLTKVTPGLIGVLFFGLRPELQTPRATGFDDHGCRWGIRRDNPRSVAGLGAVSRVEHLEWSDRSPDPSTRSHPRCRRRAVTDVGGRPSSLVLGARCRCRAGLTNTWSEHADPARCCPSHACCRGGGGGRRR